MKQVASFLKSFVEITPPHRAIKEAMIAVIERELGITLSKENITIRDGVVYIQAPSVLKSEIQLTKKKLLARVSQDLSKQLCVKDVR